MMKCQDDPWQIWWRCCNSRASSGQECQVCTLFGQKESQLFANARACTCDQHLDFWDGSNDDMMDLHYLFLMVA